MLKKYKLNGTQMIVENPSMEMENRQDQYFKAGYELALRLWFLCPTQRIISVNEEELREPEEDSRAALTSVWERKVKS